MRTRKLIYILIVGSLAMLFITTQSHAAIPIAAIIKEAVKKVVKAVDLVIQRMQNEVIKLQNAQKVLENKLSQLKLKEIADWTEKHRQLYKEYYDELWRVRNTITSYERIRKIIQRQERILSEYNRAWKLARDDDHFTEREIDYLYHLYSGILKESVRNLDQVLLVINSFKTQMSDAKRIEIITRAGDAIDRNYDDLTALNAYVANMSMHRAKDKHELETLRKLYGF